MFQKKASRRMFLQGAAGTTLALPWLPSIGGPLPTAKAAVPSGIRRVIFFYTPYGAVQEQWFPSDEARTSARREGRAQVTPLSSIEGDPSPVFRRSVFGDLLDKMVLLDGVDAPYSTGHEKIFPLTGFVRENPTSLPGPSIDQIIAERADIYETEPGFRLLNLATGRGTHHGPSISYTTNGERVVPFPQLVNPGSVFDLVFENVASGLSASVFESGRERRLSIVDHVSEDYERLLNHPALGTVDRDRIGAYLGHLRAYENAVADASLVDCQTPERPTAGVGDWTASGAEMVDNIVHALRCGLTNVVTFNSEPQAREFDFETGRTGNHHAMSHGKDRDGALHPLLAIAQHKMDLLARLLRGLDVEEDPGSGRTFLDNSLVLVTSCMGSVANHKGQRLPVALFGGRDYFKQGAIVDFRSDHVLTYGSTHRRAGVGIAYNNILIAVCQALGLRPEDYESGAAGIGQYRSATYYYRMFAGGREEYDAFAYGDRRSTPPELLL